MTNKINFCDIFHHKWSTREYVRRTLRPKSHPRPHRVFWEMNAWVKNFSTKTKALSKQCLMIYDYEISIWSKITQNQSMAETRSDHKNFQGGAAAAEECIALMYCVKSHAVEFSRLASGSVTWGLLDCQAGLPRSIAFYVMKRKRKWNAFGTHSTTRAWEPVWKYGM